MTSTDTTGLPPITVSLFGLHLLAEDLAGELGVWNVVDDFEPRQAPSVHLIAPDRRAIGLRLLFGGRAVQAFAIGGTPSEPDTSTDEPGRHRLAEGMRYSTGVTFTHAETPLESLLTAVRTVLLPAFNGHRPSLNSRGRRLAPAPAEPVKEADEAKPAAKAGPKSRARKSTARTNDAKPARRKKAAATTAI
ncbi:hypothetical protein [Streptomyces sp. NBC_01304]|uniref:hypothetical protein n=1 Tax=Streptomyces sp. NBC_01304 TaxID=2903818 RepID=UPI002E118666|nr:hypothetical protein OG430_32980 [Streptomyces sp. NBC_01304]